MERICDPLYTEGDFLQESRTQRVGRNAIIEMDKTAQEGLTLPPSGIEHLKMPQMQATIDGRLSPHTNNSQVSIYQA